MKRNGTETGAARPVEDTTRQRPQSWLTELPKRSEHDPNAHRSHLFGPQREGEGGREGERERESESESESESVCVCVCVCVS